jgi:hypothetical protein
MIITRSGPMSGLTSHTASTVPPTSHRQLAQYGPSEIPSGSTDSSALLGTGRRHEQQICCIQGIIWAAICCLVKGAAITRRDIRPR